MREKPTKKEQLELERLAKEYKEYNEDTEKTRLKDIKPLPIELKKSFNQLSNSNLAALANFLLILAKQGTRISEVYHMGNILIDYAEWVGEKNSTVYVDDILKRNHP